MKTIIFIVFVFSSVFLFGQTFSNTTIATINSTAVTTRNVNVTGVATTGMVLQQVNVEFHKNALYGGDMAKFVLTITDPSGNVVTLLSTNSHTTTSNSSNRWIDIKFRDHAALKTPKEQATATGSTMSKGYPFNQGYYRSEESFASLNTTTNVNGIWEFKMSAYATSYGREFKKVELVFGPPLVVNDIRSADPNQSCATRQCLETGDLYWADNIGYPTSQASSPPFNVGGCTWNAQNDNMAWFYFKASASTATISASGLSTVQESSVFSSPDCSSYSPVTGGCGPNDLFTGSANNYQYYNGSYAGGYAWNQEYHLSGLSVGQEYIFVLDGQAGTMSEFYIELLGGGDGGCGTPLPVELSAFTLNCKDNDVVMEWSTYTEVNADKFIVQGSSNISDWTAVSELSASGNSEHINYYNYTSRNSKYQYYRLKQVDFNGDSYYSQILSADCSGDKIYLLPNPAINQVTIIGNTELVKSISLVDNIGRKHELNVVDNVFDVSTVNAGIYHVLVAGEYLRLMVK